MQNEIMKNHGKFLKNKKILIMINKENMIVIFYIVYIQMVKVLILI